MNLRAVSACLAAAAITLGTGAVLGAGTASARPFGPVTCGAQPEDSRIVTTCTNEDDAPAGVGMQALCTNLRIFWLGYTAEANATQQFVEDCGPGAFPILWNAQGLTAWQAEQQRRKQEEQDELDRLRERQNQLDQQQHDQACPLGTPPGTVNMGRIC
ncbi:hypothetical protein BJY24_002911 [Nocardia transvalensis]|uniref:Secreted protein n=1 Tax=Nocardia transvalensis TaxID=37333 RepID=A0A7W9UI54_9NOCA|nr:hypothetical protein [Nocardia transvalensis]MBB5914044.1 hypothetical protein [Nocardia transvalensis]